MKEDESYSDEVSYLLSLLVILVQRNGGTLVIERLSEHAGGRVRLGVEIRSDTAIVFLKEEKPKRGT